MPRRRDSGACVSELLAESTAKAVVKNGCALVGTDSVLVAVGTEAETNHHTRATQKTQKIVCTSLRSTLRLRVATRARVDSLWQKHVALVCLLIACAVQRIQMRIP